MMTYLMVFIFFCSFLSGNGKQSLYKIIPEYAKVTYVHPEYVKVHEWSFKKYNRTTGAFNFLFTFKKDLDNSFTDHITGLQFKNNEFKKTAIDFNLKMCSLFKQMEDNFDIGHILENSNLTLKCPIKKGTYYVYNVIPDASNFPPLMPGGRWLYRQEFKANNVHIATIDYLWTVEYS